MSPTDNVIHLVLVTCYNILNDTASKIDVEMHTLSSDLRWGSHTEEAYSSDGLTNDLYACSLTEVEPMLRLRRRKPRVLIPTLKFDINKIEMVKRRFARYVTIFFLPFSHRNSMT
jgi:hypothetical protein